MNNWFHKCETLTMVRKTHFGRLSDVDLRLLRIFHAVVESGGVSAAEAVLNIGRSTISRYLTDLESRMGVKLCHRGPSGFSMTEEGQSIHDASLLLFNAVNGFQSFVDEVHERLTGHISLAMFDKTSTNPIAHVSEAIREFDLMASDVTLEAHIVALNEIETGVLNGRFNLGIVPVHKRNENLDYYPLYNEQMYLYCAKDHPLFDVPDEELSKEVIQVQKSAGFNFATPGMTHARKWKLNRSADVNYEEALVMLIMSGSYVGILPDHYAETYVQQGQMRALKPDTYHYQSDFCAIVRKIPQISRRLQRLLECLISAHSFNE